jgi:hypothetical protein
MRSVAVLAFVALAACSRAPETYPPDFERNFITACEAQGSTAELCRCSWERITAEIRPSDFAALERLPGPERETHPLMARINGFMMACQAQLALPPLEDGEQVPAP